MEKKTANQATIDDLRDIHRGLHHAIDSGIKSYNAKELKVTLHQLDERLKNLINELVDAKPGTWF